MTLPLLGRRLPMVVPYTLVRTEQDERFGGRHRRPIRTNSYKQHIWRRLLRPHCHKSGTSLLRVQALVQARVNPQVQPTGPDNCVQGQAVVRITVRCDYGIGIFRVFNGRGGGGACEGRREVWNLKGSGDRAVCRSAPVFLRIAP